MQRLLAGPYAEGYKHTCIRLTSSIMSSCSQLQPELRVVPQQRLQVVPVLGISVEVGHGVEHARLDRLPALIEEPHDGTPAQRGKDGELRRVRGKRSAGSCGSLRVWGLCSRKEGGNDAGADVQDDLGGRN